MLYGLCYALLLPLAVTENAERAESCLLYTSTGGAPAIQEAETAEHHRRGADRADQAAVRRGAPDKLADRRIGVEIFGSRHTAGQKNLSLIHISSA